jgi:aryl-alcohol dehydrogenase-like predicted oxidoreductase
MCQDEGMGLCPYGTLNQGRFQTKEGFRQREKSKEGRNYIATSDLDKKVSAHLENIAGKSGTPMLNIALAYIIQKAPYVFPLVGARKVEHLQGSIDALKVHLSEIEVQDVDSAYDFDPGFPHTFLSGSMVFRTQPKAATGPGDVFLTKPLGTFDWVEAPKPIGLKN